MFDSMIQSTSSRKVQGLKVFRESRSKVASNFDIISPNVIILQQTFFYFSRNISQVETPGNF